MKKYIFSLMALLLTATALVSCDDDFDDIKVNYPESFPMSGVWKSDFTNFSSWTTDYMNDEYEYTAVFGTEEGLPSLKILMSGKSDSEAARTFRVVFQSEDFEYDPEVGVLTVLGTLDFTAADGKGAGAAIFAYQSDMSTVTMQIINGDGDVWRVSTLHSVNNIPLHGFWLDGTGAIDDETGESDGLFYRVVLNSPDINSVGYCYLGAASSKTKDLRSAETLDFYYTQSGKSYTLLTSPGNEEMVLTVNENLQPVLKFRGKSVVLNFANHVLTDKEFNL